jgi:hypothetical protein
MCQPVLSPRILAALLIAAFVLAFSSCRTSQAAPPARGAVDVDVQALAASAVAEVRLTVQSPSTFPTPLVVPLVQKGGRFSALINNLRVADDYLFTGEAFDSSGILIADGSAAGVVISKGKTAKVIIYLNDVEQQPSFSNSSPVIHAITLSSDSVPPGGPVALTATAHDPDPGQTATLAFSWVPASACGTISDVNTAPGTDAAHPSESRATWTAPQSDGTCTITLTVRDILNLANSASFEVTVTSSDEGSGSASVSFAFNQAPSILGFTVDPAQISVDGETSGVVAVMATDPEDDLLSYAWSIPPDSPCAVEFASPDHASTTFTIHSTAVGAASCTFLVAVSDGVWPGTTFIRNVSTASLTLAITHPVVVRTPPVFGIAYQSAASASDGEVIALAVIASDPAGGELSFAWSASFGSAPDAADPVSLGLDAAFSSGATWTVPDGAEDATSDLVVSVIATSSASNLQSSFNFSLAPASHP